MLNNVRLLFCFDSHGYRNGLLPLHAPCCPPMLSSSLSPSLSSSLIMLVAVWLLLVKAGVRMLIIGKAQCLEMDSATTSLQIATALQQKSFSGDQLLLLLENISIISYNSFSSSEALGLPLFLQRIRARVEVQLRRTNVRLWRWEPDFPHQARLVSGISRPKPSVSLSLLCLFCIGFATHSSL